MRPFRETYAQECWHVGQDRDIPLMTASNIHSYDESVSLTSINEFRSVHDRTTAVYAMVPA